MPIIENTVNGNLNVKGTTFTKNLDVSGTAYFEDMNINGKLEANGGIEVDGLTMKSHNSMIVWPEKPEPAEGETVEYPVAHGGLKWSSTNEGCKIWAQESNQGIMDLCIKFGSDESMGLILFNKSNRQVARIGADGRAEFKSLFLNNREVLTLVDIQDLRQQIADLNSQKENTDKQISDLENEKKELQERIAQLEASGGGNNQQLQAQIDSLTRENENLQDQITDLQTENTTLQTSNSELQNTISERDATITDLRARIAELEASGVVVVPTFDIDLDSSSDTYGHLISQNESAGVQFTLENGHLTSET